jgi:hypothetical protein
MKGHLKTSIITIMVLVVICALASSRSFCVCAAEVSSSLVEADKTVGQAFNDVLAAEQAGANCTGLLVWLNVAADLLAQAEIAVGKDDSSAAANADSVLSIASEVKTAALTARNKALDDGANALWSSIVFSMVGAVVFVLALLLVWSRFRRRYVRKLFEAKPEVSGW